MDSARVVALVEYCGMCMPSSLAGVFKVGIVPLACLCRRRMVSCEEYPPPDIMAPRTCWVLVLRLCAACCLLTVLTPRSLCICVGACVCACTCARMRVRLFLAHSCCQGDTSPDAYCDVVYCSRYSTCTTHSFL